MFGRVVIIEDQKSVAKPHICLHPILNRAARPTSINLYHFTN